MNAVTERIIVTAMEMDAGISIDQRNTAMRILKYGVGSLPTVPAPRPAEAPKEAMPPLSSKPYLRRHEAATYLGCSVRQVDEMKHSGSLPFHRLGRRLIVFKTQDLEKLISRHRVDASKAAE